MSFDHFFQLLSVFNFVHMYVGGVIGCALYAWGIRYYMADNILRSTAYLDHFFFPDPDAIGLQMEHLVRDAMTISIKQLYGWTFVLTGMLAAGCALWRRRLAFRKRPRKS